MVHNRNLESVVCVLVASKRAALTDPECVRLWVFRDVGEV